VLKWFDATVAEKFGTALAEKYHERRLILENKRSNSYKAEEKLKGVMAELLIEAIKFHADNKLNMYKKARLGNTFKWKMLDLGYEEAEVDLLVKDFLLAMR
jgi:hypothetical protein